MLDSNKLHSHFSEKFSDILSPKEHHKLIKKGMYLAIYSQEYSRSSQEMNGSQRSSNIFQNNISASIS